MLAEQLSSWVQNSWVAVVTQEAQGRPVQVQSCLTGELRPIAEVAESLARVQVGDRVLVLGDSKAMAIVLAKLLPKESPPVIYPQDHQGEMVLDIDRAMTIKTPKAKIKITSAGEILIEGAQLIQQAKGVVKITGEKVLLN